MNIRTSWGSDERKGLIRLITPSFSKPSGPREQQRYSSAIPPSANLRRTRYFPSGIPGASVKQRDDSSSAPASLQPSGFPHQALELIEATLERRKKLW